MHTLMFVLRLKVHERDRENVLLGPNWWTTIPLLFEDGAIPSVAQLEDYMLLSLQAEWVPLTSHISLLTLPYLPSSLLSSPRSRLSLPFTNRPPSLSSVCLNSP